MKHIRVHEYGEPEVMHLEDAPMPEPGAGQVRVKIGAAGINYIDIYQRSGLYKPPLPFTPGQEGAGIIDALGEGVEGVNVGERTAFSVVSGAYAGYIVVDAAKLVPLPDGVDDPTALAGLVQGMTAHYLSHDTYALQPGDWALVHAAAGGTGQLLVQMAKRRGAQVIATVSTEEKAALARDLGADHVIVYTQADFEAETKAITGGRGVDVVYDSVGKDTFEKGLNVLRPRGLMALYGQSSGSVGTFDPQTLSAKGSLYLTRPTMGYYTATRAELLKRAETVFGWIADGSLRVRVDRSYPLADAPAAHRALAARETMGKIALIP